MTMTAKRAIEVAFEGLGGAAALQRWAKDNPADFYTKVWIKTVPNALSVSDPDGSPLSVKVINFANPNASA